MASKTRNLETIHHIYGPQATLLIDKLTQENISLAGRSTRYVTELCDTLLNYQDFMQEDLTAHSVPEILNLYQAWKLTALPRREEGTKILMASSGGWYWEDLQACHSQEMMLRMNNCGRVRWDARLIVLREQEDMHVVIVQGPEGVIYQIKGRENSHPLAYKVWITHFLLHHTPLTGFRLLDQGGKDFSLCDLDRDALELLKNTRPELFRQNLI